MANDQNQVTLLIHGTFANPGYSRPEDEGNGAQRLPMWWRITGDGSNGSAADRLQADLDSTDSFEGTVWRPDADARDEGVTYRDLSEWSGANSHKARVAAARELAASLDMLAERRGATEDDPLRVNFVAHSHGGNVVLEAFKHFSNRIKPRQVCMLGTPLVWRFIDPRILYLLYLFLLLGAGLLGGWDGIIEGLAEEPDPITGAPLFIIGGVSFVLFLPFILWAGVIAITIARGISSLFPGRPAYGPRPTELEAMLDGRPIQLFISPEDEADLMLQLGVAPLDAYRALVRGQPRFEEARSRIVRAMGVVLRFIELAYVRPFSYVVAVPLIEIVLERVGLGFPFRSVLFHNYEMVTWTGIETYARTQVVTNQVTAEELRPRAIKVNLLQGRIQPVGGHDHKEDDDRIEALRHTLLDTARGMRQQVHLRHSGYYESPEIISSVARAIASEPD